MVPLKLPTLTPAPDHPDKEGRAGTSKSLHDTSAHPRSLSSRTFWLPTAVKHKSHTAVAGAKVNALENYVCVLDYRALQCLLLSHNSLDHLVCGVLQLNPHNMMTWLNQLRLHPLFGVDRAPMCRRIVAFTGLLSL